MRGCFCGVCFVAGCVSEICNRTKSPWKGFFKITIFIHSKIYPQQITTITILVIRKNIFIMQPSNL